MAERADQFDDQAWTARFQVMAQAASRGCGQSYELFEQRFSSAVDELARNQPGWHQPLLVELARPFGYASADELDARPRDDAICSHGIDRQCCPVGCADAE